MKKLFIESARFTEWVRRNLDDVDLAEVQQRLLDDPEVGSVIPGCGGIRKLRFADAKRRKGKRGGARLVYLHVSEVDLIFLLYAYGKDEQDDLSAAEKRGFANLVDELKKDAISLNRRVRR